MKRMTGIVALFLCYFIILLPISSALQIADVKADPQTSSVTITWRTDQQADSLIAYGPGNLDQHESNSEMVINHQITIRNLQEDTTYQFKVASTNSSGYKAESSSQSFKTKDTTPPPQVLNLRNTSIGEDSVTIVWDAVSVDDLARYHVYRDSAKIHETSQTQFSQNGLEPGRAYNYQVSAVDTDDNEGMKSDPLTIHTQAPDVTAPVLTNVSPTSISLNSATIGWTTDEDANSTVYYSDGPLMNLVSYQSAFSKVHSVSLSNLQEHSKYYYKARSCDRKGNCADSQVYNFIAGSDLTPPPIEADVPATANTATIVIRGSTRPYSSVKIYVENVQRSFVPEVGASGEFAVQVTLDTSKPQNTLKIEVKDANQNSNSKTYTIRVDVVAPKISIEDIPEVLGSSTLDLKGSSNEHVRIEAFVTLVDEQDTLAPGKIRTLQVIQSGQGASLQWEAPNGTEDLAKYLIYRSDVGLMAESTQTNFLDVKVTNATYSYQIRAMDDACNIGEPSGSVSVTLTGISVANEAETINETCDVRIPSHTFEANGPFSESVPMKQGSNILRIIATDDTGNTWEGTYDVYADSSPPTIIESNLASLSPAYIPEITIRGKVNENATVAVCVNGKVIIDSSDLLQHLTSGGILDIIKKECDVDDGDYDYVSHTDAEGYFEIEVVLDRVYNSSSGYSGTGGYGQGSSYNDEGEFWDNDVKIIVIDRVGLTAVQSSNVRYTLCGQGSDWNIRVGDITPGSLNPRLILEGMAQVGFSVNLSWQGYGNEPRISGVDISEPPLSQEDLTMNYDVDWVQRIDDNRWSADRKYGYVTLTFKHDPNPAGSNWTYYQREENISNHRMGECFDLPYTEWGYAPEEIGCVRLPLMITITYQNNDSWDPTRTYSRPQKQCWNVELMIEPRIDPGVIPEEFLNWSIHALNQTIEAIDAIYEPIRKITQYTIVACIGLWAAWLVKKVLEIFECKGAGFQDCYCGRSTKDNIVCQKNGADDDKCTQCYKAKLSTLSVWDALHWVCDRVSCPPVPSFEAYIREKNNDGTGSSSSENKGSSASKERKLSHCEGVNYLETYKYYQQEQKLQDHCKVRRVLPQGEADPDCCDDEYIMEWSSGCWGMDEFKESQCLAAANAPANQSKNYYTKGFNEEAQKQECGGWKSLFRYLADFKLCKGGEEGSEVRITIEDQLFVMKKTETATGPSWKAYTAKTEKRVVLNSEGNKIDESDDVAIVGEIPITSTVCDQYAEGKLKYTSNSWPKYTTTSDMVITILGSGQTQQTGTTGGVEKKVPESIVRQVCTGQTTMRKYVVDPTSGLLRTIQCVCLSGITSYLGHYRRILQVIMNCFQQILYTGDGSSGICQAAISTYICDLIYYSIACITERPNYGLGQSYEGGLGMLQFIGNAGAEVRQGIQGRYGDTNLVKAIFVEKKLVHAVCVAAFTGDWDIDWEGIVDSAVEIPLNPTVAVFPATRRFMTYDPISGYASHIYHVGLFILPGADELRYHVKLICSSSDECPDFEGGYCDCAFRSGEKEVEVTSFFGNGGLTDSQVLNVEKFVDISTEPRNQVRYDKVRVEYEYRTSTDSTSRGDWETGFVEQEISEIGDSPAECSFDIGTASYQCPSANDANGSARFEVPPSAVQSMYGLDDALNINSRIIIDYPGDDFRQYWLEVDVRNQNGASLGDGTQRASAPSSYVLAYEGLHELTKPGPEFKVEQWMFEVAGPQSTCTVMQNSNFNIIDPVKNNNQNGVLKFTYDSSVWKYLFGTMNSGVFTPMGSTPAVCETGSSGWNAQTRTLKCANVEIRFSTDPTSGEMVIACTSTGSTTSTCNDATPRPWNAVMTLYEETSDGNRIISSYRGAKQQHTVPLQVRCVAGGAGSNRCDLTGYTPNTQRCDCNGNSGMTDVDDCDGTSKQFCYEHSSAPQGQYRTRCEASPACQEGKNTRACDCDKDGDIDGMDIQAGDVSTKYCCAGVATTNACSGTGTGGNAPQFTNSPTLYIGSNSYDATSVTCVVSAASNVRAEIDVTDTDGDLSNVKLLEGSNDLQSCSNTGGATYSCMIPAASITLASGNEAFKQFTIKASDNAGHTQISPVIKVRVVDGTTATC
ncbi:hypothetical protein JW968_03535 [Candidatus Woesearchaeota archaeon]|nr:hypothetical protein [Candidatus Woesearchaeota archaeon]